MGGWNVCTMVGNLKEMANASRFLRFCSLILLKVEQKFSKILLIYLLFFSFNSFLRVLRFQS